MINVLVVEDDPMVAELNRSYLEKIPGFRLAGTASNSEEAETLLTSKQVDLLLLDVYMPGINGLEFLKKIRERKRNVDVILITATSATSEIQQALRLGAVDYLIKPFEFSRFQKALHQYKKYYWSVDQKDKMSQEDLDQMLQKQSSTPLLPEVTELPKGLTKTTLETLCTEITTLAPGSFSTEELASAADISRVSVRKYLKFLTSIGFLEETLTYGVGRPIYQYRINEANREVIQHYL
ncbi:MAG: response regulator [Alkalicoccus sp.]|nr:MAG: response regulator [Alkalicoccus sp.]